MSYTHRIIEMKVRFNGLYKWGEGWSASVNAKWDDYLANRMKSFFWSYAVSGKGTGTRSYHLLSTTANVFLHPMDFTVYIPLIGRSGGYTDDGFQETFPQCEELLKISKELAEYCGGEAVLSYCHLHEFNDNGMCNTTEIGEERLAY